MKFKLHLVGTTSGHQLEMFNPYGTKQNNMIKYEPKEFLKKIAPKSKIEKLMTGKLTVNRAVLSLVTEADFISKQSVETTALKTIRQYKERYYKEREDGATPAQAREDALNDKKLLVNRVQNTIVNQVAGEIKDQYRGASSTAGYRLMRASQIQFTNSTTGKNFRSARAKCPATDTDADAGCRS